MNYHEMITDPKSGKTIQCRPSGNSMLPLIKSKQLITISPLLDKVEEGDIVFCRVNGSFYFHLVKKIGQDGRYLITNNRGHENGWIRSLYGKIILIED